MSTEKEEKVDLQLPKINNIEKNSGLSLHKMSQRSRDRNEWRAVVMSAGDPIDEHGDGYK